MLVRTTSRALALIAFLARPTVATQSSSATTSCPTVAAPSQTVLSSVQTASVSVPNRPFGLAYATLQKDTAFAALTGYQNDSSVGVLNTSSFTPVFENQISLPSNVVANFDGELGGAQGLTLSNDGKYLFAAADQGAIILDTDLAATGSSNAIVGTLNGTTATQTPGNASIIVTLTNDGSYAFVSQEYGNRTTDQPPNYGNIDIFKLEYSSNGSVSGVPIEYASIGGALVGTSLSPDQATIYAVIEEGYIATWNATALENNSSTALISKTNGGCSPVRTLLSSDGSVLWVTARGENRLLAFDTSILRSPNTTLDTPAMIAAVQVGTNPVGLAFVQNETRIITADSSRSVKNSTTGLSVVDVKAALDGSPNATLGRVPTGVFPREFSLSPDGLMLLVSDYDSLAVQAVNVSTIP